MEGAKGDDDLQNDLNLLAILLLGIHIEKTVSEILLHLSDKKKAPLEVAKYVESNLERFTNANHNKVSDLVGKFSNEWRKELDELPEEQKSLINSVISNRNSVAHGRSVNITPQKLPDYVPSIYEYLNDVDAICTMKKHKAR